MQSAVRVLVAVVAGCFIAVGLLTIALGQGLSGASTLILGLVGIVVVLYERRRYSSKHARGVDSRFRPTNEVFVDPSSGQRMRVHVDPESGERQYLPDSGEPDLSSDR
jgi:hypothetical protein